MTDPEKVTDSNLLEKVTISPIKGNTEAKSVVRNFRRAETHLAALGWAFTDTPAIQAYQRHTGEDIAPVFARYREWAEENLIGALP